MTKLFGYQREGVDLLHARDGRALLADAMGLGKTIQALTFLVESGHRPAVIVVPAGLKIQWAEEAMAHCKLKVRTLWGQEPNNLDRLRKEAKAGRPLVVNPEILKFWLPFLVSLKPKLVICDEAHMYGSLKSQRTQTLRGLCRGVPHVVMISGTPLTNRPWELFPILNILRPKKYNSPFSFGIKYCEAERKYGEWCFSGARNLKSLHRRLAKTLMIRRTKEEVLKDLPPKRLHVVPLAMSDDTEYWEAERDLIGWLASKDLAKAYRAMSNERYTRFTYLKHEAARGKVEAVEAWLDSFLRESDGKILVGTIHRDITKRLYSRYRKQASMIIGGMTAQGRKDAENLFRKKRQCRLLFGQIKAAGVGLNLPESSTVALAELPWTPGACQQFIDRCYRLTSKSAVDAYFLVAHGTIEELLCKIIERKQRTLDKVLDGVDVKEDSLTIFEELQAALLKGKKDARRLRD